MPQRHAVIGLGFGDEGKGRIVDYLASKFPEATVVRFCGGAQAAHHVVLPTGESHVFSSFGSGTLRGAPTFWSHHCPFDPVIVKREWNTLTKLRTHSPNVSWDQLRLIVDYRAPVVTPFDVRWNRKHQPPSHGTCGCGIFATINRERHHFHLWFEDLYHPEVVKLKLERIAAYYNMSMTFGPEFIADFTNACNFVINNPAIEETTDRLDQKGSFIFEGSQGLMLDQNYGFFPHVTPSNTGMTNVVDLMSHMPYSALDTPYIWLVTRAYQTRHGAGPMSPVVDNKIKDNPYEENKNDGSQGQLRKTLLDLDFIKYAADKDPLISNEPTCLVITCMDLVEEEYRVFEGGVIYDCRTRDEFINKVRRAAGADVVKLSFGPYGELYNA